MSDDRKETYNGAQKIDDSSKKVSIGSEIDSTNAPSAEESTHELEEKSIQEKNIQRIIHSLALVGTFSSGIVAVEPWIMNDKKTSLLRPDGAFWRDPHYVPPRNMDRGTCLESLKLLEDLISHPQSTQPGLGIAGKLWAEKSLQTWKHNLRASNPDILQTSFRGKMNNSVYKMSSSFSSSFRSSILHRSLFMKSDDELLSTSQDTLVWRDLYFMSEDPDHIPDNRIKLFLDSGIGQVAGVPFNLPCSQGIILYFAKSNTDPTVLNDKRNVEFLKTSSVFIGATLAWNETMIPSIEAKKESTEMDISRFFFRKDETSRYDIEENISSSTQEKCVDESTRKSIKVFQNEKKRIFIVRKLIMVKDKLTDFNHSAQPPPPMSNLECAWTFFGAFATILFVVFSAEAIEIWSGNSNYKIPIGPFGALVTLLYGLTAAPPSQPRNTLYGTLIAGCTGIVFSYIPSQFRNLRISLATSVAITAMGRAGVIHPPGGALALILSASGNYGWGSLLSYLLAVIIVIIMSVLINNMNERRKYPQYWSLLPGW